MAYKEKIVVSEGYSCDICGECVRVVSRALDLRIDPTDDECG